MLDTHGLFHYIYVNLKIKRYGYKKQNWNGNA